MIDHYGQQQKIYFLSQNQILNYTEDKIVSPVLQTNINKYVSHN